MKILAVNAGSSSLKFTLIELPEKNVVASGLFEKIGINGSCYTIKYNGEKITKEVDLKDHSVAVQILMNELIDMGIISSLDEIEGVGHRMVHGGQEFTESVVLTEDVLERVSKYNELAPLHNPANIMGVKAFMKALPNTIQVGVFDTAFHTTMKEAEYLYPVPYEWYEKYGIRKYGFHGTSHKYITTEMKERLGKEDVNLIICHVGSGASISAIKNGKCYDTTMGLTPVDGLMMGTRCGSIDPSITEYMIEEAGLSVDEVSSSYNKKSGLLGICGFNDNRDVEKAIADGDENAKLALDMYIDRIVRYISQYYVELEGKVDAIVMTAGVLENGSETRADIVNKLSCLGLKLNEEVNDSIAGFKDVNEGIITSEDSSIPVYVLPTNEEIMIIKDTYELCK